MDAVDGFSLRVGKETDGTVVRLSGELDIASAPMLDECLESLDGEAVTIDFANLTFIDSSGLQVLVQRHRKDGAAPLVLRRVQPSQMKVFMVTGLDELFNFDGE